MPRRRSNLECYSYNEPDCSKSESLKIESVRSIVVQNWATSWENLSSEVCDQIRLEPACSATEAKQSLETLDMEFWAIILSKRWMKRRWSACASDCVNAQLRGCAGWSVSLLFAYGKPGFSMTRLSCICLRQISLSNSFYRTYPFH